MDFNEDGWGKIECFWDEEAKTRNFKKGGSGKTECFWDEVMSEASPKSAMSCEVMAHLLFIVCLNIYVL